MSESKHIMIIAEQDSDLSSSLTLFFSQKYRVLPACTMDDIRENIEDANILLIEADLINTKAITILKEIKRLYPRLSIVVMGTTIKKSDYDEAALSEFANAVVYKPFDVGRISRIISQLNAGNILSHSSM